MGTPEIWFLKLLQTLIVDGIVNFKRIIERRKMMVEQFAMLQVQFLISSLASNCHRLFKLNMPTALRSGAAAQQQHCALATYTVYDIDDVDVFTWRINPTI